jgi:hypothetical protein
MNLKGCHIVQGLEKCMDKKNDKTHWDYIQEHLIQRIHKHFQKHKKNQQTIEHYQHDQ